MHVLRILESLLERRLEMKKISDWLSDNASAFVDLATFIAATCLVILLVALTVITLKYLIKLAAQI